MSPTDPIEDSPLNQDTPRPMEDNALYEDDLDYAEDREIRDIHAAVIREQAEPHDGNEPLSLSFITFCFILLMIGGWYLGAFSGGFDPEVFDERVGAPAVFRTDGSARTLVAASTASGDAPDDPMEIGRKVYRNCAACHQASGQGAAGQYPSLIGSTIATGGGARLVKIILKGAQGPWQAASGNYNGVMQPWAQLKDEQVAAVATYVRKSWGNDASEITPDHVAAIRTSVGDRKESWTYEELAAQPDELPAVGEGDGEAPAGEDNGEGSPAESAAPATAALMP